MLEEITYRWAAGQTEANRLTLGSWMHVYPAEFVSCVFIGSALITSNNFPGVHSEEYQS